VCNRLRCGSGKCRIVNVSCTFSSNHVANFSAVARYFLTISKVSRAAKALDEILSKWRNRPLGSYKYLFVDARYEKVRQDGCVVDSAVLIAHGIDLQGKRRILGVSVSLSEQEVHWRHFFNSLSERGLCGIELIISDAHAGLKAARKSVFPSIPWLRAMESP